MEMIQRALLKRKIVLTLNAAFANLFFTGLEYPKIQLTWFIYVTTPVYLFAIWRINFQISDGGLEIQNAFHRESIRFDEIKEVRKGDSNNLMSYNGESLQIFTNDEKGLVVRGVLSTPFQKFDYIQEMTDWINWRIFSPDWAQSYLRDGPKLDAKPISKSKYLWIGLVIILTLFINWKLLPMLDLEDFHFAVDLIAVGIIAAIGSLKR